MACRCWVETVAPGRIMRLPGMGLGAYQPKQWCVTLHSCLCLESASLEGAFPQLIVILPLTSDDHRCLLLSLSFLLWTILKILIDSVPTLLLFYVLAFWPWGMWDLSSPKGRVLVALLCLTLCDPTYCSPTGSSVGGILQARILEWVAMPFSGSSRPRDWTWVSCIAGRFFTVWATREAH